MDNYLVKEEFKDLAERLNSKLRDEYGYFTTNTPNYRIVWSDDQFEYRDVIDAPVYKFDAHGNKVGEETGIMFLPKYRQWIPHMWVLEKCVSVGELGNKELVTPYSYEPIFPFRDRNNNALPPNWDVCWLAIAGIHYHMGLEVKIYRDPDLEPEVQLMRISSIMESLFPNESDIGDALAQGSGVGYTSPDTNEFLNRGIKES